MSIGAELAAEMAAEGYGEEEEDDDDEVFDE